MGKEAEQIGDRCYSTAKHYQSGIAEFSYQLTEDGIYRKRTGNINKTHNGVSIDIPQIILRIV